MGLGHCKGGNTTSKSYSIIDENEPKLKWCYYCKSMLSFDKFGKDVSRPSGLQNACLKCRRKIDKEARENNKEKYADNVFSIKEKQCYMCGKVKDIRGFHIDRTRSDGFKNKCKDCCKTYQKQWYQKLYQAR